MVFLQECLSLAAGPSGNTFCPIANPLSCACPALCSWQELVDLLSSRGYHPVLHTRSAAQPPDSCSSVLAVFYKDAKFALEWTQEAQHGLLVCLQHRDDAPCQEPSASSLRSSDYLHVVNVHLEASPLLPGSRLHQLKAILGLLSEKLGSRKAAAAAQLVLAGDLGSTRQASPCAFLSSGRVDAHWTEAGLPKVRSGLVTLAPMGGGTRCFRQP